MPVVGQSVLGLVDAVAVLAEHCVEVAQLPDQLAAMTRDAVAAGCDPDVIRGRVDDALSPEQAALLERA